MTTIVPGDEKTTAIISSTFAVEFGTVASGLFTEASGLGIDIEEVKSTRVDASGKSVTRFSPGTVKYQTITLKREFNGDKEFWKWHDDMCKGLNSYTDGSIVMYNLAGEEVDRWNILRAWPSKWSVSDLDAGGDDVVTEDIELQIEFLERAK
ncbi:MAG: phage tail protein [Ilumatobacteraceae bacterium]